MKYENLKEINSTVKQIEKLEKELEEMATYETGCIKLIIADKNSKTVMTIGANKSFEHSFSPLAELFITDCIQLTRDKITKLKKHLETL